MGLLEPYGRCHRPMEWNPCRRDDGHAALGLLYAPTPLSSVSLLLPSSPFPEVVHGAWLLASCLILCATQAMAAGPPTPCRLLRCNPKDGDKGWEERHGESLSLCAADPRRCSPAAQLRTFVGPDNFCLRRNSKGASPEFCRDYGGRVF